MCNCGKRKVKKSFSPFKKLKGENSKPKTNKYIGVGNNPRHPNKVVKSKVY